MKPEPTSARDCSEAMGREIGSLHAATANVPADPKGFAKARPRLAARCQQDSGSRSDRRFQELVCTIDQGAAARNDRFFRRGLGAQPRCCGRQFTRLPFNVELAAGSLEPRPLPGLHHTRRDLSRPVFAGARDIARPRRPIPRQCRIFAQSALGAIAVEQALHSRYLQDFGVDPASIADAEPSPDCLAYTSYLIAAAYHDPWEVLVAALLPCFWIYWDVGCAIARSGCSA